MEAEITISNYRCFTSKRPARITINTGETAFIGMNNSGKSTILRFFYELRDLFIRTGNDPNELTGAFQGNTRNFALPGATGNILNIYNNTNQEDIEISLKVPLGRYLTDQAPVRFSEETHFAFRELVLTLKRGTHSFNVRPVPQDDMPKIERGTFDHVQYSQPGIVKPFFMAHYYEALKTLGDTLYIAPFRNILNLAGAASEYFDIKVGSQVISSWNTLKNGDNPQSWEKANEVTELLRSIFGFKNLEINANDQKNDFWITIEGKRCPLSAMGSGFAEFLLVLANLTNRNPAFVLIDEPESHLHPSLQAAFISTLRSLATEGVLFATHSIGLARAVADRIYSLRRVGVGHSEAHLWEKTPRLSEFIGEMGFSAYQELGFEVILLVEGPTEVKVVQQILRLLGKDHQIVAIPLGGSSMITGGRDLELVEITRITNRVACLIDSERGLAGEPLAADRRAFQKSCDAANISCLATDLRATENYFTDSAVKKAKSLKYRALGPFERLDDAPEPKWGKSENWMIAREMSDEEWRSTDVGRFLDNL